MAVTLNAFRGENEYSGKDGNMSTPRYDWWPYVKGMIRRYPELCAQQKSLHEPCLTYVSDGMPHGRGKTSDPVANTALRELPDINRRELEAVRQAAEETRTLKDGAERMKMIRLVFWDRTHTLEGAAMKCRISYATARRWHGEFIKKTARKFGFI